MKIRNIKCFYYDGEAGPCNSEVRSVNVAEERIDLIIKEIKDMHPSWSEITVSSYEKAPVIHLSEFIENFMHNNEVVIENRYNYEMHYRYFSEDHEKVVLMDWELQYTDISDCDVICVKNVIRQKVGQHITIKVDTDKTDFIFDKDKVTLDNAPLWLYNKMHGTDIQGCDAG